MSYTLLWKKSLITIFIHLYSILLTIREVMHSVFRVCNVPSEWLWCRNITPVRGQGGVRRPRLQPTNKPSTWPLPLLKDFFWSCMQHSFLPSMAFGSACSKVTCITTIYVSAQDKNTSLQVDRTDHRGVMTNRKCKGSRCDRWLAMIFT